MQKAEGNKEKLGLSVPGMGQDEMDYNKQQFEQDNLMHWVLKLLQMLNPAWDVRSKKSICLLNKVGLGETRKMKPPCIHRNWLINMHILR